MIPLHICVSIKGVHLQDFYIIPNQIPVKEALNFPTGLYLRSDSTIFLYNSLTTEKREIIKPDGVCQFCWLSCPGIEKIEEGIWRLYRSKKNIITVTKRGALQEGRRRGNPQLEKIRELKDIMTKYNGGCSEQETLRKLDKIIRFL